MGVNLAALTEGFPFLARGRFILDTVSLAAGTAIAQGIAIAVSPVLTRLYSADQFGILSLYTVILSTASAVVCLSYEPAIVLPTNDSEGASILFACGAISGLVAALSLIVIFFFGGWLAALLRSPELGSLLWWVPANLFAVGAYQAMSYWTNRRGRFTQLAESRVWQSGATAVTQVAAGMAGNGAIGLVCGQVFGQVVSSLVLAADSARSDFRVLRSGFLGTSAAVSVLKRYRNFPQYSTWGTLMNAATFQLVPLVLATFYGPAVAGFYFLGFRVVNIPMSLIGGALGQVLLQRTAAELSRGRPIANMIEVVVGRLILLSTAPFIIMVLVAPWLFALLFGQEWFAAGQYIQALAPLFLLQFITSPVSVVLIALQKQQLLTLLQGLMLFGAVGSLAIAAHLFGGPLQCLLFYSLIVSLVYVVYLYAVLRCSSASIRAIFRESVCYHKLLKRR